MNGYEELWKKFRRERRLEPEEQEGPEQRDGLSASFMVPVEAKSILDGLGFVRKALRPFPFVSLHPDHFMHITLLLPGFLVREPESEDQLSPARLEELASGAREALVGSASFSMELRNLNAFPGAAFVEVHDGGALVEMREAIRKRCGLSGPPGPPHLTVAYLRATDGEAAPDAFVEAVEGYRNRRVGEIRVDRVELTLLDLKREYPKPEVFATIPLGGPPEA